jgi:5'-deoxynucleotidase YfbR-like HD superfamily hydrolase
MARKSGPPRAWQRMLSGRRLDLLDPSPLDVEIEDIAHGLARVARWNGQTRGPNIFSVAQHSLLVEALAGAIDAGLPARARLMALLHDAPEYVIGDIISPFKAAVGATYKTVENRILAAIHMRYSLPPEAPGPLAKLIKRADLAAAFIEATRLAGFSVGEAETFFGRPDMPLRNIDALLSPMSSDDAEAHFLRVFHELETQCRA